MIVDLLGSVSLWAGALVAIPKLVDWLLSPAKTNVGISGSHSMDMAR